MAKYVDCYFLENNRSIEAINRFLDSVIPDRKDVIDDFMVDEQVFTDSTVLMKFLVENPSIDKSIYWENMRPNNLVSFAMVMFTDDGKVILGYSIKSDSPRDVVPQKKFVEIKELLRYEIGTMTVEEVPPLNSEDFRMFCNERLGNL
jgi:hypothetical protein